MDSSSSETPDTAPPAPDLSSPAEVSDSVPLAAPSAPGFVAPSAASLATSTGVALAIASVLLVFVVLPAEYNLDATGFGRAIGLTRLSDPDAGKAEAEQASDSSTGREGRKDSVVVEVPAGEGLEYKFSLRAGEKMKYSWSVKSTGPGSEPLFFDFHGDPKGGKKGSFESYSVSTASEARGTFTAPFEGSHGWYWKNKGETLAKVTLVTSGSYRVLGLR